MADPRSMDDSIRDFYESGRYTQIVATAGDSVFARYMHRAMESQYHDDETFPRVLEVGGDIGEHVPYVHHGYSEYLLSDLRQPKVDPALMKDGRLRVEACDVADLPQTDGSFDRVICTCLLHHVDSPLLAMREMRRVTRIGGVVTILLPTDPGLAYRTGKRLTSGRAARREGIGEVMTLLAAIEHRNHFESIRTQLRHVFRHDCVRVRWLPFRLPLMNANAFAVFDVTIKSDRVSVVT